jgi:hypothetical protein
VKLQNNKVLAQRLLSKELEPATVINMSPAELKVWFPNLPGPGVLRMP